MNRRTGLAVASLAVLLMGLTGEPARGTKFYTDTKPKPVILLGKAQQVLALSAENCLTTYDLKGGKQGHRFQAGDPIQAFDVSADERFLACSGSGHVTVWDVQTGRQLWRKVPTQSGQYTQDLCFAWDGQSFVVSDYLGVCIVYQTGTGEEGRIPRKPGESGALSAALNPDGSKGVLVNRERRLFIFTRGTGTFTDTGIEAGGPVRYAADGKHVACLNKRGLLRIVQIEGPLATKDEKHIYPNYIRPERGGGFLVSGRWDGFENDFRVAFMGLKCIPGTGEMKEVWRAVDNNPSMEARAFDPDLNLGATTTYALVTKIFDLRTGKVSLTIDNSKNYQHRPLLVSTNSVSERSDRRMAEMFRNPLTPVLWLVEKLIWLAGLALVVAIALLGKKMLGTFRG